MKFSSINTFFFGFLLSVNYHAIGQEIEVNKIKNEVSFLASDELNGRGTGTVDEAKAAAYIAKQFEEIKLTPKGEKGTFLQSYEFIEPANPHATTDTAGKKRTLTNVIGYLDNGAKQTIVIGGHYDHLG